MHVTEPGQRSQSPSRAADAAVLVVEDDAALARIISMALQARGYRAFVAATGKEALALASEREPDVIILDLGLPDVDGIAVCNKLRTWYANPVIVLSADGSEDRKIAALDEGADDYVTKPFSMPELLARIRVALRHRAIVAAVADATVLSVGNLEIDTGSRIVKVGGAEVDLTAKEYELLLALARAPGRVITHGALFSLVWPAPHKGSGEALRVHVTQLRKKLVAANSAPRVVSVPGIGYRLLTSDAD